MGCVQTTIKIKRLPLNVSEQTLKQQLCPNSAGEPDPKKERHVPGLGQAEGDPAEAATRQSHKIPEGEPSADLQFEKEELKKNFTTRRSLRY